MIARDRFRDRFEDGRRRSLDIVGIEQARSDDDDVHTIDVWFSQRRGCWVVERLNAAGHLVGTAHCCASEHDAEACLTEWLRAHGETHLAAARGRTRPGERDDAGPEAVPGENVVRLAGRCRAA